MPGGELQITGIGDLDAKLLALEVKTAKKTIKKATKSGAAVILRRAKLNVLRMVNGEMGELLYENLQVRVFKKKKRHVFGVHIQLDPNEGHFIHYSKTGHRTYIPFAIEYGHDSAVPIPFMRNAVESQRVFAVETMIRELKIGIEREAKK